MADETPKDDELKIEIVDDLPPEDRGKTPMPKELVEEVEKDDLEEYSDKVRKRLSQLKIVYHDERRAREQAERERLEAVSFAEQQFKANQQLKQRLGTGERIFKEEVTKAADTAAAAAKEQLKAAYESGDAQKIADAQEALTKAQLKANDWSKFQPSLQPEESGVQVPQQSSAPAPAPVQVDRRAQAWRDKNPWFGEAGREEMTALALGLHEKLVRSNVDATSDEYYERIDKDMRLRFPDYFKQEDAESPLPESKPEQRKQQPVVAPASRTTAPRQIRLTATQAALAKRLGITPEAYAREKLKLENANG